MKEGDDPVNSGGARIATRDGQRPPARPVTLITGELYMHPENTPTHRTRSSGWSRGLRSLAALGWLLLATGLIADDRADSDEYSGEAEAAPETTFVETVTVAATLTERSIQDTPGQIDVIAADDIENLGYSRVEDLIRWTPGVYVEGDLTRLGSSGFNIRGIGGNRVLTEIDGVPTAEQFDFGPFSVHQFSLDLDTLERAEVVRSAGSALYGSDALGGVVSLVTRSPRSYLGQNQQYLGFRAGYDDRAEETSESVVYARGDDRWQGALVFTHRDGSELDNQGEIGSTDFTRTEPNPIDRQQDDLLLKLGHSRNSGSQFELSAEVFRGRSETEILSGRAPASPFSAAVLDSDADDSQDRRRLRLEQSLVLQSPLADSLLWRGYAQTAETEQATDSRRQSGSGVSLRDGLLSFEQTTFGIDLEARKALGQRGEQLLTYGLSLQRDDFDSLRDRTEVFVDTGAPVPTTLTFPTKYFPESEVTELGAFLQGELSLASGRLRLVPGLRFDSYDLAPNFDDTVFLAGNPGQEIVDIKDEAVSPKLGVVWAFNDQLSAFAQYARGFRAPPMSAVNNGFTNPAGGYRTLANPDLEPETSDNYELGFRGSFARGSFSVTAFENRYDDFIETVFLGFNPALFLVEFQPQNLNEVEISGIEMAADLRLTDAWRLRGAYSLSEGDDVTAGEPLDSIAPPRWVSGLRYARPGARWGVEATATFVDSKDASDLPSDSTQFQAPSYEVFDVAAWMSFGDHLRVQVSAWNLSDETYWQWAYARGQTQGSAVLDRYTSSGRSFGVQLRAGF